MRGLLLTIGGLVVSSLALVVCIIFMYVGYANKEASLKTGIAAQQKANEASFDTMWKILKQQAGVADEYKEAFKQIYPDLIKGRYSGQEGKNLLAKFITESNPNFDTSLYSKLMASIEAERKSFLLEQKKLIDYKREYDLLSSRIPSKFFVSGDKLDIVVITSDTTEDAFKSGKEGSVELFPKK